MSETTDQARTRRRWITLAEFVAVAGLIVGAGTLYLNWSDRRAAEADKAATSAAARKAGSVATLTGEVRDGGATLALVDAAHTISAATVRFPVELKLTSRDAMPGPRVEAAWVAAPLLALTDDGADEREGRLPVLIATSWWEGDAKRSDAAIYDLLWRTEGRVLQGRKLVLAGLALRERTATPTALEAAWRRERPRR